MGLFLRSFVGITLIRYTYRRYTHHIPTYISILCAAFVALESGTTPNEIERIKCTVVFSPFLIFPILLPPSIVWIILKLPMEIHSSSQYY